MLPDLGKYAVPVLAAYASMIVLLGGLAIISLRNAKKSKRILARLEANRKPK
ncbi:MAG: heme exporter protein CcmD [Rhodobacteraceae bacterium]|nr:heme exporter protein CcmD [Paracoccaceae bacterium]